MPIIHNSVSIITTYRSISYYIFICGVFCTLFIIYVNPITYYRKVHNLSSTRIFFLRTHPFHYSCLDWLNSNKKKLKKYSDLRETFRIPFAELGGCCYNCRNNLPFHRTPRPTNDTIRYLYYCFIAMVLPGLAMIAGGDK